MGGMKKAAADRGWSMVGARRGETWAYMTDAMADLMAAAAGSGLSHADAARLAVAKADALVLREAAAETGIRPGWAVLALMAVVSSFEKGVAPRRRLPAACCLFGAMGHHMLVGTSHDGGLPTTVDPGGIDDVRGLVTQALVLHGTLVAWRHEGDEADGVVSLPTGMEVPDEAFAPLGREAMRRATFEMQHRGSPRSLQLAAQIADGVPAWAQGTRNNGDREAAWQVLEALELGHLIKD